MKKFVFLTTALISSSLADAAGQAFPRTDVGSFEIKTLPAGRVIEAEGSGSYFDRSNNLFRPLFRYIDSNEIAMTTPVEARMDPGKMVFWIGEDEWDKAVSNMGEVAVVDRSSRTVASAGFRGAYSETNFIQGKAELLKWLEEQPGARIAGEPYAVFWDGPMSLPFLKRFEVHVDVIVSGDSN